MDERARLSELHQSLTKILKENTSDLMESKDEREDPIQYLVGAYIDSPFKVVVGSYKSTGNTFVEPMAYQRIMLSHQNYVMGFGLPPANLVKIAEDIVNGIKTGKITF